MKFVSCIGDRHVKLKLKSHKNSFARTILSIALSFWNFTPSTTALLPCFVRNWSKMVVVNSQLEFRSFCFLIHMESLQTPPITCTKILRIAQNMHSVVICFCCCYVVSWSGEVTYVMMTSWNENAFHITGPLFVMGIYRSPVDSLHKGTVMRTFGVSLMLARWNRWTNTQVAVALIRYGAHMASL